MDRVKVCSGNWIEPDAQLVWKSRVSEDTRAKTGVSTDHEYLVCYSRGDAIALRGAEKDIEKFANPDRDPRGPWRSADLTGLATKEARPNLHYDLIDPQTKINYGCPPKGWRYEKPTMLKKIAEGRILFPPGKDGRPRHKLFLNEMRSLYKNMSSVITEFSTADGTREVNALLGQGVFSFPKPTGLLASIIEQATQSGDIVMDFFAGSGTTGHATWLRNQSDAGDRRFILVQLPEPLDPGVSDQHVAATFCDKLQKPRNIAELTKERLRRAAKKIKDENPMFAGDLGFRCSSSPAATFGRGSRTVRT
jgi:adenine-specific DNA-methyltransferase